MENPDRCWNNLIGFEVCVPFEEKYLFGTRPICLSELASSCLPDSSKISEVICYKVAMSNSKIF